MEIVANTSQIDAEKGDTFNVDSLTNPMQTSLREIEGEEFPVSICFFSLRIGAAYSVSIMLICTFVTITGHSTNPGPEICPHKASLICANVFRTNTIRTLAVQTLGMAFVGCL